MTLEDWNLCVPSGANVEITHDLDDDGRDAAHLAAIAGAAAMGQVLRENAEGHDAAWFGTILGPGKDRAFGMIVCHERHVPLLVELLAERDVRLPE